MNAIEPLAMFNFSPTELIIVGIVGILLFGRRLPEIGRSLGKTIVEFKKGLNSSGDQISKSLHEEDAPADRNPYRVEARPTRQTKQIAGGAEEP
ncbi:MAG TPA: twin-arginine translocase TatA/TatE family subunit [Phycisphaerae bacterium]|jgi:sec-independent protein translocase protein TatA|nr:twin-arginine translocase TatA/TatE family subunit [Phycisphaerae bacterium]